LRLFTVKGQRHDARHSPFDLGRPALSWIQPGAARRDRRNNTADHRLNVNWRYLIVDPRYAAANIIP
jgi:hypothetical protein